MQLSRGKLVASFAAVTLGGVLLAVLGVAFTSSTNPPMVPAIPAPATLALATPEKQVPLKPALPLGISPQLYALAVPPGREPTAQLAALGEKLFKDKRLSVDDSVACETCHDPTKGFTDHRGNSATSAGVQDQHGKRNAPTVLNAMFQASQFWDGRAPALEDQAKLPILNPIEMGQKSPGDVVAKVARIQEYSDGFKSQYRDRRAQARLCCAGPSPISTRRNWPGKHRSKPTGRSVKPKSPKAGREILAMPGSPRIYAIRRRSAPIESMIFENPRSFQIGQAVRQKDRRQRFFT